MGQRGRSSVSPLWASPVLTCLPPKLHSQHSCPDNALNTVRTLFQEKRFSTGIVYTSSPHRISSTDKNILLQIYQDSCQLLGQENVFHPSLLLGLSEKTFHMPSRAGQTPAE